LDSLVASTQVSERVRDEPRRFPAWMTVPAAMLASVAVVACAAFIWVQVVHTIRHPTPIPDAPPPPRIAGVVWGDRVFVHVRSLRSALAARGVGYAAWARKHPAASTVLRARTRHR
jgi:hypothetical protein